MSQLVIGIHAGFHDSSAVLFEDYRLKAAVQLERLTRVKGDASVFPHACVDEVLAIAGAHRRDVDAVSISRMFFPLETFRPAPGLPMLWRGYRQHVRKKSDLGLASEIRRLCARSPEQVMDVGATLRFLDLPKAKAIHFYDHHEAHALPALFYTDWETALLVTADFQGDMVSYSHRHLAAGKLTTDYGGTDSWHQRCPPGSLGQLYAAATLALGFQMARHEGKVMGLAAMGEPTLNDRLAPFFWVDESGRVHSSLRRFASMRALLTRLATTARREDVAASVQKVVEDTMLCSLRRLIAQHPARRLGLGGGLFANVKLNQVLSEQLPLDEIFVFPPMGDEGLPVGGVLAYLLRRDGLARWLSERYRLDDLYLGRDYTGAIDAVLKPLPGIRIADGAPVAAAAQRLAEGRIGAIYTGRMEYGPRALGARSILANPALPETRDHLNRRLRRHEFMPFAPVLSINNAARVLTLSGAGAHAARFMTTTTGVKPEWRQRIPVVVHVDGTARPQILLRHTNPLYFDILTEFERQTGIPALVNTSFNVHEEPIVNRPEECAAALLAGCIDFVVTERAIYEREGAPGY